MSIENVRDYLSKCLDKHTYCDNDSGDEIVNVVYDYFKALNYYSREEVLKVWFAIRMLLNNNFNEVTNADIVHDILCNTENYRSTFNINGKDEIELSKEYLPHSCASARIRSIMTHIAKKIRNEIINRDIHVVCPDDIPVSIWYNFTRRRYIIDPDEEVARVICYLRACLHNPDRYRLYADHNECDFVFNLVDWVSYEVSRMHSDSEIYIIWFAVRLLILNNFSKVSIDDVERMRCEHPRVFDKCLCINNDDESTSQSCVCYRIESMANEIRDNCRVYGGSFQYNKKLPYLFEQRNNNVLLIVLLCVLICVIVVATIALYCLM